MFLDVLGTRLFYSRGGAQCHRLSDSGERHGQREPPRPQWGNDDDGASWEVPSKERKSPKNISYLNKKKKRWIRWLLRPFQALSFYKITCRKVFTYDWTIFSLPHIFSYAKDFVGKQCHSFSEKIQQINKTTHNNPAWASLQKKAGVRTRKLQNWARQVFLLQDCFQLKSRLAKPDASECKDGLCPGADLHLVPSSSHLHPAVLGNGWDQSSFRQ